VILGSPGGNCSKDVLFLYGKGNIVWLIKTFYQEKDNVILAVKSSNGKAEKAKTCRAVPNKLNNMTWSFLTNANWIFEL
jgi:hypothetical protein